MCVTHFMPSPVINNWCVCGVETNLADLLGVLGRMPMDLNLRSAMGDGSVDVLDSSPPGYSKSETVSEAAATNEIPLI